MVGAWWAQYSREAYTVDREDMGIAWRLNAIGSCQSRGLRGIILIGLLGPAGCTENTPLQPTVPAAVVSEAVRGDFYTRPWRQS